MNKMIIAVPFAIVVAIVIIVSLSSEPAAITANLCPPIGEICFAIPKDDNYVYTAVAPTRELTIQGNECRDRALLSGESMQAVECVTKYNLSMLEPLTSVKILESTLYGDIGICKIEIVNYWSISPHKSKEQWAFADFLNC
jgi:hypothetical protein